MLSDTEILIEVAKLDDIETEFDEQTKEVWQSVGNGPYRDYMNSHDAIIPVIHKVCISYELKPKFIRALELVRYDNEPPIRTEDSIWEFGYGEAFEIILEATPRQLSIALLKSTGKYKD